MSGRVSVATPAGLKSVNEMAAEPLAGPGKRSSQDGTGRSSTRSSAMLDGIPFSADRGACHHILPELTLPGRPTFVESTPSFSVALLSGDGAVVHGPELPGHRPVVRPADQPAAVGYLATGPSGSTVLP